MRALHVSTLLAIEVDKKLKFVITRHVIHRWLTWFASRIYATGSFATSRWLHTLLMTLRYLYFEPCNPRCTNQYTSHIYKAVFPRAHTCIGTDEQTGWKTFARTHITFAQAALFVRVSCATLCFKHTIKIMLMNACVRMRVCARALMFIYLFVCVSCVFSRFAIVIRGVNGSAVCELFPSVIYVGETPLVRHFSNRAHDKENLFCIWRWALN